MVKSLTTFLISSILLLSCSNNDKQKKTELIKDTTTVDTGTETETISQTSYFTVNQDSITVGSFEIEVSLSPKAKEKITSSGETIIIDVSLTGEPMDSTLYSEDGRFYVANVEREISYGQIALFGNITFSKRIYDQLRDKNLYVNAFAYSGRKSSPNNLLDCEIIADSISNIVNKKFIITGKLIGEK